MTHAELAREKAMCAVRAWWDAECLKGSYQDHKKAPAWSEYMAACAALDVEKEAALSDSRTDVEKDAEKDERT